MEQIRVNTGITVEVNEAGDTIRINVEDQNFIDKFYGMVDRLEQIRVHMGTEAVKKLGEREQLQEMIGQTKQIMTDIDGLFGERTCEKVFGKNVVPTPYVLTTFFEQMLPVTDQYATERQKNISRLYNRQRKGGRSKYRSREELIQDAMR